MDLLNHKNITVMILVDSGEAKIGRTIVKFDNGVIYHKIVNQIEVCSEICFEFIVIIASHTAHVVCVNFIREWRDLRFNVDSEGQFFEKLFHGRFC